MAGALRLIGGFVIAAGFIVAWLAFAWVVMLVTLYIVRLIPLTSWRRSLRRADANTIVPWSQSDGAEGVARICERDGRSAGDGDLLQLAAAKNPIDVSSGEKNGAAAPSVPAIGSART